MKYYLTLDTVTDFKVLYDKNLLNGVRFNTCKWTNSLGQIEQILELASQVQTEILIDIPFPYNKIRIIESNIDNNYIQRNNTYYFTYDPKKFLHQKNCCLISNPNKIIDSSTIYYADGNGAFKITDIEKDMIQTVALNNFIIWNTKGISWGLQSESQQWLYNLKTLLNKYGKLPNLKILLSFVTKETDIIMFKKSLSKSIKVLAKIEGKDSLSCLNKIAESSDGIVLARGDLLTHNGIDKFIQATLSVPYIAKKMHKPFYVATDILISLYDYALPRRSEISDIMLLSNLGYTNFIFKKNMENYPRAIELIENISKYKEYNM